MSHYVFITRRANPFDAEGPEILVSDWEPVALSDTTFREQTAEELAETQRFYRVPPRYFVWTGHNDVQAAFFGWNKGQIEVKHPDEPMIAKMVSLAEKLDADVVSETGEIFNADGSHKGFRDGGPW